MSERTPIQEVSPKAEYYSHHEAQVHHEKATKHREQAAHAAEKRGPSHEKLHRTVEAEAISSSEYPTSDSEQRQPINPVTKLDKTKGFETIMHQIQNDMKGPEQRFSTFIHHPAVERTSEVIGNTIVRPSGVIGATLGASLGLLSVYGVAKFAGFGLSGSEVPFLLCIGFVLGLFLEWCIKSLRVIFGKNKKTM